MMVSNFGHPRSFPLGLKSNGNDDSFDYNYSDNGTDELVS
jgi:hypothetical protein